MKYPEKKYMLSKEQLNEHAILSVVRSVMAKMPHMSGWKQGKLSKTPTRIYDLNGSLLFCDYSVKKGVESLGTVRMAASNVLGATTIAYELDPRRWNYKDAVKKLRVMLAKKYKNKRIINTKLICYSYPKIGVMVNMKDKNNVRTRLIFDIASLTLIPEGKPDLEGAVAWSYYAAVKDNARASGLKRFAKLEKARLQIPAKVRKEVLKRVPISTITKKLVWPIKFQRVRELEFCSHYRSTEARSHHCFVLHAQQVNDYCAVATCQMILCYYRYYYTQEEIAPSCGYSAGGGCPPDSSAGYETMSNNHIEATYDSSANWSEAKAELDKLHPMKSGTPGHARAVAGYSYLQHLFPFKIKERKLLVYDPWPWDLDYKLGGSVSWEDWNSVTHTNFIYTKLKT